MEAKYSFYATLTVNIFLDDNDFDFICQACKNHYDRKVKNLVEIGGFLYDAGNRRTSIGHLEIITDEDRIIYFTSRQLGLIMKSFEMQSGKQASRLNLMFHKIASEMAESEKFINQNIHYTNPTVYGYVEKTK